MCFVSMANAFEASEKTASEMPRDGCLETATAASIYKLVEYAKRVVFLPAFGQANFRFLEFTDVIALLLLLFRKSQGAHFAKAFLVRLMPLQSCRRFSAKLG